MSNSRVLDAIIADPDTWAKGVTKLTEALQRQGWPEVHARMMACYEVRALLMDGDRRPEWGL